MAAEATKIPFVEGSAPATPAANRSVIYVKSDGLFYSKDDAGVETLMSSGSSGSVATDAIWDAAGDLAVGSGANTAAKLTLGATNGMALQRVSGAVAWALPPGYEFDYVEKTTDTTVTGTAEGSETTVITGTSVAYDGSTTIMVEFFSPRVDFAGSAGACVIMLYDGATVLGRLATLIAPTAATSYGSQSVRPARRLTPSAASHQYIIKAWRNVADHVISGGAGGSGTNVPAFLRVTKV